MLFLVDSGELIEVRATSAYDAADLAWLAQSKTATKRPAGSISVHQLLSVTQIGAGLEGDIDEPHLERILLPQAVFTTPESAAQATEEPAA